MADTIPGLDALAGDNPTHCPLCNTPVTGSDGLQLHYLTRCESYDRLSNEQPRPKPKSAASSGPTPRNTFKDPSSYSVSGGVTIRPSDSSVVQFMWQPLTDIAYPEIMLLASFEPGSVTLKMDPDIGHYASDGVTIPNGVYEGQLVIGDSFIYPVKKFTVANSNDIIVLQFDVIQGKEFSGDNDLSESTSSHYGTGYMQHNPSYTGSSYTNPTYAGHGYNDSGQGGGLSGYSINNDLTRGSTEFSYGDYNAFSSTSTTTTQPTVQPRVVRHTTTTANSTVTSHTTNLSVSSITTNSQSSRPSPTPRVSSRPTDTHADRPPSPDPEIVSAITRKNKSVRSEFNVGELQQQRTNLVPTDMGVYDQQLLETVSKERDELKQSLERVNALWDGRVKRLEAELETFKSGGTSTVTRAEHLKDLQEARDQVTQLEQEVAALKREREEMATNNSSSLSQLKRELTEMKDRNTALEQQLLEYTEQYKYHPSSVTHSRGGPREGSLLCEQDLIHMSAFAKKQQLEHAEALAELSKRREGYDDVQETSGRRATELAESSEENVRLLQEIASKNAEIETLRGRSGGQGHSELEVATLWEKVTAYQEEFEKIGPIHEELQKLREQRAQQVEEIRRLTAHQNVTGQLQAVFDNSDKVDPEIARKASEYDTLLDRYHELQTTRINLENELQPLRQERATILRENALLRESSNPESYSKLKQEHESLKAHCEQIESVLTAQEDTSREMQTKLDEATNPQVLEGIQKRLEKYKAERVLHRNKIKRIEQQLAEAEAEKEAAQDTLKETNEQSERVAAQFQQTINHKEFELSHTEKKMYRYRDERNSVRLKCKDLEKQLAHWKELFHKSSGLMSTSDHDDQSIEYDTAYSSPHPASDHTSSPTSDYHPQAYTDDQIQLPYQHEDKEVAELESNFNSLSMEPSKMNRKRTATLNRTKQFTEFDMVDVQTKEGTKVMRIGRPRGALSAKNRPKVVVKRGEEYEQGTLMFVDEVGGRELAGIQMDCRVSKPSSSATASACGGNDGTYRDGRRYFRCPVGLGLYVALSKIFVEMESAYV